MHACVPPQPPLSFPQTTTQLIVKFKPGATQEQKGKALGKGRAAEKRPVRSDAVGGDVSLVTVAMSPGRSGRAQLRAAAAQIQAGECAVKQLFGATDNIQACQQPAAKACVLRCATDNSGRRCAAINRSPADRHNRVSMCAAGRVPALPVRLCAALCR